MLRYIQLPPIICHLLLLGKITLRKQKIFGKICTSVFQYLSSNLIRESNQRVKIYTQIYFVVILISIVCDLERFRESSVQTDHLSRIVSVDTLQDLHVIKLHFRVRTLWNLEKHWQGNEQVVIVTNVNDCTVGADYMVNNNIYCVSYFTSFFKMF